LWLLLGVATGIKRVQDDSFIFGKDAKQQAIVACAWPFG
jgi:hypothetical protein